MIDTEPLLHPAIDKLAAARATEGNSSRFVTVQNDAIFTALLCVVYELRNLRQEVSDDIDRKRRGL